MGKWNIWRKTGDTMTGEDSRDSGDTMTNEDSLENGSADNEENMEQMYIPGGTDKLDNAVNALITAVLECEEYLVYREELDRVLQIPGLKAELDEYRKRNYELQSRMDIDFEKLDRFEKEFENFRSNPAVSDFLAAELAFCKRMQAIETRVTAELDFQ
ncbi:MAG: YlbF family regulator [Butyrivibrio sp.]|nr:YlbF family regulator [Acetatifactor muris]MCM1560971.1 YlbF family regulator [Butyrivibrio sp.]